MIKSLIKEIRYFICRVKRLLKFFPVIWDDVDWDYSGVYDLMLIKLRLLAEEVKDDRLHKNAGKDYRRILTAIGMLERIIGDTWMEPEIKFKRLHGIELETYISKTRRKKEVLIQTKPYWACGWWHEQMKLEEKARAGLKADFWAYMDKHLEPWWV